MSATQLVALHTMSGPDGDFERGDVFNVENPERVAFLTAPSGIPGVPPFAEMVAAPAPVVAAPVANPAPVRRVGPADAATLTN